MDVNMSLPCQPPIHCLKRVNGLHSSSFLGKRLLGSQKCRTRNSVVLHPVRFHDAYALDPTTPVRWRGAAFHQVYIYHNLG
jgi:hypothetical protein